MLISIIITELLIILKFDFEVVTKPLPSHICYFWLGAIAILLAWTVWRFFLKNTIKILYQTVPNSGGGKQDGGKRNRNGQAANSGSSKKNK